VFDQVSLTGDTSAAWAGRVVGDQGGPAGLQLASSVGSSVSGGRFTVSGSGDIAPLVPGAGGGPTATLESHLAGSFGALLVLGIVAALVVTTEYRRGLIRVTLAATPRRGQVLAAKALVVAAVGFVVGLVSSIVAVVVGTRITTAVGRYEMPVSAWTTVRVIGGTSAVFALVAVLALAVGTMVRRSAAAVASVVVGLVLPYLLGVIPLLPLSAAEWLLRVTPAAGLAIEQSIPHYTQVQADYTPPQYFPLSAWAGFAVLCAYVAAALLGAYLLLRRRDA
jgi:ABC-type transport system involved in multi-copper enzyme maturation permease subunit